MHYRAPLDTIMHDETHRANVNDANVWRALHDRLYRGCQIVILGSYNNRYREESRGSQVGSHMLLLLHASGRHDYRKTRDRDSRIIRFADLPVVSCASLALHWKYDIDLGNKSLRYLYELLHSWSAVSQSCRPSRIRRCNDLTAIMDIVYNRK